MIGNHLPGEISRSDRYCQYVYPLGSFLEAKYVLNTLINTAMEIKRADTLVPALLIVFSRKKSPTTKNLEAATEATEAQAVAPHLLELA